MLPYITKGEGAKGNIKEKPEHFIVEEVLLYEPSGKGDHAYINLTKKGITSRDVQEKLASLFKIKKEDIGFAGMKDKNSVSTQTFSLPIEEFDEKKIDFAKVNWVKRHKNKLKIGHLLGNKFEIIISKGSLEKAEDITTEIKEKGVPNYFGEQRFGYYGDNAEKGKEIILGKKINDRWLRRFLVNSYQSHLCNLYLAERVEKGYFDKILEGDICKKHKTGGLFAAEDVEKEQMRYDKKEISFTAPIFGRKMWEASSFSKELEDGVLKKEGIILSDFKMKGTRRLGRLLLDDISVEKCPEGIKVKFFLPKGGFATTVLREIMKN